MPAVQALLYAILAIAGSCCELLFGFFTLASWLTVEMLPTGC